MLLAVIGLEPVLNFLGALATFGMSIVGAWVLRMRARDRAEQRAAIEKTTDPEKRRQLDSLPPLDPVLVLILAATILHAALAGPKAYALARDKVAPAVERALVAVRKKPAPPSRCGPDCRDDCKCPLGKCECASAPAAPPRPRPRISSGELAAVSTYAGEIKACGGFW